ncbi:CpcT/CpeT family chromophore lyase [Aliidiomarina sanyensis]|nr:CpcT/CpeT family chromophore lyase [Aliidiomarina sanyensis]
MTSVFQKVLGAFALITFLVAFPAVGQAEERESQRSLLLQYLVGEFSNLRTILETGRGAGHAPIFVRNHRLAWDDEDVIWSRQSLLNTPNATYRQQVYRFVLPRRNTGIVQQIYLAPASWEPQSDDWSALERLQGCDIVWRYTGDGFVGSREGSQCGFVDEQGRAIFLATHLQANSVRFTVEDAALSRGGELILGDLNGEPVVHERIRFFDVNIEFLPAGASSENDSAWIVAEPFRDLHDHDIRVPLVSSDERMFLGHDIQVLGNSEEPTGLTIRVYRQAEEQPVLSLKVEGEDGRWSAEAERFRIQLRAQERFSDSPHH